MPVRRSAMLVVAVVLVLGLFGHLRVQHAVASHAHEALLAAEQHAEEADSHDPVGEGHDDCHKVLAAGVARHGPPFEALGVLASSPTVQVAASSEACCPALVAGRVQPPRSPVADGVVLLT